jgi:hypothetical protein
MSFRTKLPSMMGSMLYLTGVLVVPRARPPERANDGQRHRRRQNRLSGQCVMKPCAGFSRLVHLAHVEHQQDSVFTFGS